MIADHRRILATGIARLRSKIKYRPVVFELMPPVFSLLQLQRTVEALAGRLLHKPGNSSAATIPLSLSIAHAPNLFGRARNCCWLQPVQTSPGERWWLAAAAGVLGASHCRLRSPPT